MQSCLKRLGCGSCVGGLYGDDNSSDNNNRGTKFSEVEDSERKNDVGTVNKSGLNPRQAFSLRQSWKAIMRDEVTFGVEMFIR